MKGFFCGTSWNRTSDTRIFSPLLYQLSYGTIFSETERKNRTRTPTLQENFNLFSCHI